MGSQLDILASYVSPLVRRRIAANATVPVAAVAERFSGAVLFADVAGFTPLAERLAQRGSAGAEEISRLLNDFFNQIVADVCTHGGYVLRFAGDALLAVWPSEHSTDLSAATLEAVRCARVGVHPSRWRDPAAGQLAMRLGVGAGEIWLGQVGGVHGRWESVAAGDALVQAICAQQRARPGEVVIAPPARVAIAAGASLEPLAEGYARVEEVHSPSPVQVESEPALLADAEAALRAFVPDTVLSRLDAAQLEWLAELRRVTMLFVHVSKLDYSSPTALDLLQAALVGIQEILVRYEGSLRQLVVDDKGTILVGAFGVPPCVHEDDPARAVEAAFAVRVHLDRLGLSGAVGIATGQAFCGPVGGVLRREYAMIGDVVNLAARLMECANDGVFCDAATYRAAHNRVHFERLPGLMLKRKAAPVVVYSAHASSDLHTQQTTFGRAAEMSTLRLQLNALHDGRGGTVMIEGEAGIGKSKLVGDLTAEARLSGLTVLVSVANAVDHSAPYHCWRAIFAQLFRLDMSQAVEARRAHVLTQLPSTFELSYLTPLLNAVLPLDVQENDMTRQLAGQVRADNTQEMLVRLLEDRCAAFPVLIVLEDAHWLDSASWALALQAAVRIPRMLLVLSARPLADPCPAEYTKILSRATTIRVRLDSLTREDTELLLRRRLSAPVIAQELVDFVQERTEGNPFFVEELAYSLRDGDLVVMQDGTCRIAPGIERQALTSPDTVQGVISSRIDQLSPAAQLTLKVASVIGRTFTARTLRDVYPVVDDVARLPEHLDTLARLELTPRLALAPEPTYVFKHAITQEVTYGLMLFSQRRQLHRSVAEWYEREHAADLRPHYVLLAHHWSRANVLVKAADYAELAGEQALHGGACREALHFFSSVLAMADNDNGEALTVESVRRGRWERQLAEACLGLGEHAEGRRYLQKALASLGWPEPGSRPQLAGSVLRQVARQATFRLAPGLLAATKIDARARPLEAARAYIRLVEVYWFANNTPLLVHSALRALNLAERAGPSAELARAYAIMCLAAGSVQRHRLAELYARRALETATQVSDLSARAYALFIPSVYRIGVGSWERIGRDLEEASGLLESLGDRRLLGDARTVLAMSALYRGEFGDALQRFSDVYAAGLLKENVQHQIWGLIGRAESLLRMHQLEEAANAIDQALALLAGHPDRAEELRATGLRGVVHLQSSDANEARSAADRTSLLIAELGAPTSHYLLEGYAGASEIYLTLLEKPQICGTADEGLVHSAEHACAALAEYARVFAIGKPRAHAHRGRLQWLGRQRSKALASWQTSLREAEQLRMPYEQLQACQALVEHVEPHDPRRSFYEGRAAELLDALEASASNARPHSMSAAM